MRKIPHIYENPFDDIILNGVEYTAPFFYDNGFTPNMITTLSNITCILVIILLFKSNYWWAAFFLIISYYFDCLDGHIARSYNMTTVFGDYYDHISDVSKTIAVLISLYIINPTKFYNIIPFVIVFTIFGMIHIGCQEVYYNSNESESLEILQKLCPLPDNYTIDQLEKTLSFTKYFGLGSFYAVLFGSIVYYST